MYLCIDRFSYILYYLFFCKKFTEILLGVLLVNLRLFLYMCTIDFKHIIRLNVRGSKTIKLHYFNITTHDFKFIAN